MMEYGTFWHDRNDFFECCQKCTKRNPGCHGSCEEYKAAKARFDEMKEKQKKERAVELTNMDFEIIACLNKGRKYNKNNR